MAEIKIFVKVLCCKDYRLFSPESDGRGIDNNDQVTPAPSRTPNNVKRCLLIRCSRAPTHFDPRLRKPDSFQDLSRDNAQFYFLGLQFRAILCASSSCARVIFWVNSCQVEPHVCLNYILRDATSFVVDFS
jgi:hypothetical protein